VSRRSAIAGGLAWAVAACGGSPGASGPDGGPPDTGRPDGGSTDTGRPNGGSPDTGSADTSRADAERPLVVPLVPREVWGGAPARDGGTPHAIERLTVHHSADDLRTTAEAHGQLRAIQAEHQGSGWVDLAYHYLIDLEGNVYAGRDPGLAGDTYTTYDPTGHLLVCLLGNFEHQDLRGAQLAALAATLAAGAHTHGVATSTLAGHGDYEPATACPGRSVDAMLRDGTLRERTDRLLASRQPRFSTGT
jgi:hypothetical protein